MHHPAGAFHVHSEHSHDSTLTLETIAQAAKTVDLDFVVLTDHNQQLASPITIAGVTLFSYAELSTAFGHTVALGARTIPDKSGRLVRDIHQVVAREGGRSIIAHPSSLKRPWTGPYAGAGGLEIANVAAALRRRAGIIYVGLLPALAVYRLQPDLALQQIYDRDDLALRRWDDITDPAFVGFCGADAHGWIDVPHNLNLWRVVLDQTLPEDVNQRADAILEQLITGRFACVAGAVARNPAFRFVAQTHTGATVSTGGTAVASDVARLVIEGPGHEGGNAMIVLLRHGDEITRTAAASLLYDEPIPGTYRVEVRIALPEIIIGARMVPILYSNRIQLLPSPGIQINTQPSPNLPQPTRDFP